MEVENNVYDYNRDDILAPQPHHLPERRHLLQRLQPANDTHARALTTTKRLHRAFMLSSYRPGMPLSYSAKNVRRRQLSLSWGVRSLLMKPGKPPRRYFVRPDQQSPRNGDL